MNERFAVQQQVHGYRNGHGLIGGSIKLDRDDQDLIDRLSDIAGPVRPSEVFAPYLTLYPLPSEQFYVVARTWQDLDVPRAGCVLTRSALIPMAEWEQADNLLQIVEALERPVRDEKIGPLSVSRDTLAFSPVVDGRLAELVEALFLESRQPIVVFGSPDAATIGLRIVSALWPSRRRTFTTCTWCLGPRRLSGRDFDLVFAPQDARSRFSDWSGRRIEVTSKPAETRHRWTGDLLEAIFVDERPTLTSWDELGVLSGDQVGDEGALRLSLMWRELAGKARTTPNAVLGMLDILNAHGVKPLVAREHLEPLVQHSVPLAVETLPAGDAWKFLSNLLGKFPSKLPSSKTLRILKEASCGLARKEPQSALAALRDLHDQGKPVPAVVAAGMGDGLALSGAAAATSELGPRELARLMAYSKQYATALMNALEYEPSRWNDLMVQAIDGPDHELMSRNRRNLMPSVRKPEHARVLQALLDNSSASELATAVATLGKTTGFSVEAFDLPVLAAARDEGAMGGLRRTILASPRTEGADRLLARSVDLNPIDIEWLDSAVGGERGLEVLASAIGRSDDATVQSFARHGRAAENTVSRLLTDPRSYAGPITRLLRLGHFTVEFFGAAAMGVRPFAGSDERRRLDQELLKRVLIEAAPDDAAFVARVVEETTSQISASDLILLLTPLQASGRRLMANIEAVESAPPRVRHLVVQRIDQFTNRLITRGTADFDEAAYVRWARLLEQSAKVSPQNHLNACVESLSYSLRQTRAPISPLIVAAFPTVYQQLLQSKGEADFDFIPALLLLPLTFFTDWDRAKTARREIVDAFMESRWPPANLLLAGLDAGIDQKILRRISRNRGGGRYIEKIVKDAGRLPAKSAKAVRNSVKRFSENPRLEDWD